MSNAASQNSNSNPGGARFVFTGGGIKTLTLGSGNTLTALPIEVASGTTLGMGTSVLEGSGIFTLNPGATLETAQPEGLDNSIKSTGQITLSKNANYSFNGASEQVTGHLLPDSVSSLIVDNSTGITLSNSVTVVEVLDIKKGILNLGSSQLLYGTAGTLRYSGSVAQITAGTEFPASGGPKNLSIANNFGVTLHASRIIPGNLELSGKLRLGENNLTALSASSAGLTRYVITNGSGELRLSSLGTVEKLFPVGTNVAYAPVWITNSGDVDTIGVNLVEDIIPAAKGGRVKVKWNISESKSGGGNYTLKFGWVNTLENPQFRADRENNSLIFNLSDTTEAGNGNYLRQLDVQPYTISVSSITALGSFAVGRFRDVVGIEEENNKNLPEEYYLSQNYPNPFNPTTVIGYRLPAAGNVKLSIYNLFGQKIKTLIDSFQNTGEHSIVWDGTDDGNNPVSSGIYFYRLETNGMNLQRKMMLIR
jgi:hypothetical protein